VREERPAPRTAADRRALARLTEEIFGTVERDSTRIPTHQVDELLLLSSWFRKFPEQLERTTRAEDAGLERVVSFPVELPRAELIA
jgi:excinuclease ABC subunit C